MAIGVKKRTGARMMRQLARQSKCQTGRRPNRYNPNKPDYKAVHGILGSLAFLNR
jgi:hypothetical protein